MRIRASAIVACLAFAPPAYAQPADRRSAERLEPFLEKVMREKQIPGLAVGIVESGRPVYVRGFGEATEHVMVTQMDSLSVSAATRLAGERAFSMAGASGKDFNHVMLYDAFTSGPPIMLESLGLAKPGEGVQFFTEGRSTPGGSLPINTNGGGLSYTHSGMYGIFPIIEATRQLRGECAARQVPGASCSLVNGMGGMLSAAGTLVLANRT